MVRKLSIFLVLVLFLLPFLASARSSSRSVGLNLQSEPSDARWTDVLRLIQVAENKPPMWLTEDEILVLIRAGVKFMDVTEDQKGVTAVAKKTRVYPDVPNYVSEVSKFIPLLEAQRLKTTLKAFTSFHTRYYRSSSGADSSKWLFKQILAIINAASDDIDVSVKKFKHSWVQKSIIARFEGSDPDRQEEVVIVGAHQDSINMWFPMVGRSPGADDDGSGTVTILEAFRVLVEGGFKPTRPVEFHWYSAEEVGLLGSQAVAQYYARQGIDVIGMLQNDMTGYVGNKKGSFGIIVDYVDDDLTLFLKKLAKQYANMPIVDTKCGYACSDHASWRKAGYPSAFAFEGKFENSNPYIHTSNDVLENLDFDHMLEFSKLAVSFAVELSHID
uniref:Leucine aminopeptidase 1 n=1 Tax=Anthurium amnicola TaxID=1678845 RepID=A0A1D1YR87_9ARAE